MALGNVQLVCGMVMAVGPSSAASWFTQPGRRTASALLVGGILLAASGWVTLGLVAEALGVVQLFGDMSALLFSVLRALPYVGPAAASMQRAGVRAPHIVAAVFALAAGPAALSLSSSLGGSASASARVAAVLGGTGTQGGAAVRALLESGRFGEVRTMTRRAGSAEADALRDAGAEVVEGSLGDAGSLARLLEGADSVFALTLTRDDPADEAADGARLADALAAAAPACVVLSGGDEVPPAGGRLDAKHAVELEFRARGLPAVYLHTAFFYESLEARRGADGVVRAPLDPNEPLPLLAGEDVGRAAARVLAASDPARGCPPVAGVGDGSPADVVRLAGEITTPAAFAGAGGYERVAVAEAAGPPVVREMYEWLAAGHPGHARDSRHVGRLGARTVAQWRAAHR